MSAAQAGRESIHDRTEAFDKRNQSTASLLRLLFLVPFAPSLNAPHGGARVIAQLITHLAKRHRIALCYLRATGEPSVDDTLSKECEVIEEVVIPETDASSANQWQLRGRVWGYLLAGKPLWAIGRSAKEYSERVRTVMTTWCPDIVQIEYHIMGQYLSALDGYSTPRILVQHEPGKKTAEEAWRSLQGRGVLMACLNWLAWMRFEPRVMHQVQAVVVFTERDKRVLSKLALPTPLVRIPLATELPEHTLSPLGGRSPSLLFVGNFLHPPNLDAAFRLTDHIFPLISAQLPDARLHIVGSHPPSELLRRATENTIITDYVPDVTPYLDLASLVVAPLRMGGGMRVKVLEALAAGKAIVATSLAISGLDLTSGEQVVLAETDAQFSEAIVALLNHPDQRASIAGRARMWACANLRWDDSAVAYEDLYARLLNGVHA
jgi:glycosyltransferase involved in cell wall biosynthesis